jgi:hypothetical protein
MCKELNEIKGGRFKSTHDGDTYVSNHGVQHGVHALKEAAGGVELKRVVDGALV